MAAVTTTSSFVFATCNAGSEPALKAEVARTHGAMLSPAFMRPGLITWKSDEPLTPAFDLKSVFARVSGLSLGLCKTTEEITRSASAAFGVSRFHAHCFPREVPEDGITDEAWNRIDTLHDQVVPALLGSGLNVFVPRTAKGDAGFGPGLSRSGEQMASNEPKDGGWVLDLIFEADGGQCLAGIHRHWPTRHPLPGALPRIALPPESPSRAFLKIEQALAWQGLDAPEALAGLTALELGCAPGGATYALLRRGVNVIGVDTGVMSPLVGGFTGPHGASFTHLRMAAGALADQPLPKIDLLVSDMNLAPPLVLKYVEAAQRRVRARLLIVTLKLNNRAMESRLHEFLAQFARFAPGPVRATQLQANRREVCLSSRT